MVGFFWKKYCNNSWAQIVELLNSNVQSGLSENDCEALRLKYGTNKIDLPSGNKIYKHILNAFKAKIYNYKFDNYNNFIRI